MIQMRRLFITNRDVTVIEKGKEKVFLNMYENKIEEILDSMGDISEESTRSHEEAHLDKFREADDKNNNVFVLPNAESLPEQDMPVRSEREKKPKDFSDYITYLCAGDNNLEDTPLTVLEAHSKSDGQCWRQAMAEEMISFKENDAWNPIDFPEGSTVVKYKWVFKNQKVLHIRPGLTMMRLLHLSLDILV